MKEKETLSPIQKDLILHNNYGICQQLSVKAKDEGLSRVQAFYEAADRTIEGDKADVASY